LSRKDKAAQSQYNKENRWKYKSRVKVYNERYYNSHREQCYQRAKEYNTRLKYEVLSHYSKGIPVCINCGYKDIRALSVDHINGDGNEQRKALRTIGRSNLYSWLKGNNYPEGYQVLCMNCQFIKREERDELRRNSRTVCR